MSPKKNKNIYFLGFLGGVLIFYIIFVLSSYLQLGYIEFGIPDAEFAFLNFINYLIVLPIFILLGISITQVYIRKKISKLVILAIVLSIFATGFMLIVGINAVKEDLKMIKLVNSFEQKLRADCSKNGYLANRADIDSYNYELFGGLNCIDENKNDYYCRKLSLGYNLTGIRPNAPGFLVDEDGPAYGYDYKIILTCGY